MDEADDLNVRKMIKDIGFKRTGLAEGTDGVDGVLDIRRGTGLVDATCDSLLIGT